MCPSYKRGCAFSLRVVMVMRMTAAYVFAWLSVSTIRIHPNRPIFTIIPAIFIRRSYRDLHDFTYSFKEDGQRDRQIARHTANNSLWSNVRDSLTEQKPPRGALPSFEENESFIYPGYELTLEKVRIEYRLGMPVG